MLITWWCIWWSLAVILILNTLCQNFRCWNLFFIAIILNKPCFNYPIRVTKLITWYYNTCYQYNVYIIQRTLLPLVCWSYRRHSSLHLLLSCTQLARAGIRLVALLLYQSLKKSKDFKILATGFMTQHSKMIVFYEVELSMCSNVL